MSEQKVAHLTPVGLGSPQPICGATEDSYDHTEHRVSQDAPLRFCSCGAPICRECAALSEAWVVRRYPRSGS